MTGLVKVSDIMAVGSFRIAAMPIMLIPSAVGIIASARQYLHSNGCAQNDHSAIAKYYEKRTGIRIGR